MPSRLLKIEQAENNLHVKLCDSAHFHPEVQYETLSHAWGRAPHIKLICENMKELKQGIPISKLPRTFTDAVELTNSLSLRYLWVDSLCIIQENFDKSDWERECSKMGGIYSGSFISIAANPAADSEGGLFALRNPLEITPCIVKLENEARGGQRKLCALSVEDHQMRSFLATTRLNQRAWVFQERVLAPRTVHFSDRKIVWQCGRLLATEIDLYNDIEKLGMSYLMRGCHVLGDFSYRWSHEWGHAVENYSSGRLTYDSDKLVAIAGVAKYFFSKVNAAADPPLKYLAGLWNRDLAVSLLWYSLEPEYFRSRPQHYRAPRWSWAAVTGRICFASFPARSLLQTISIDRAET